MDGQERRCGLWRRRPASGPAMGRLKTLFRILTGRRVQSGGREKPLPAAPGGSRWSIYLTETVSYHH